MNASKEAMWGTEMGMMPSAPLTPSISGQEMGSVEIIRGGGERLSVAGSTTCRASRRGCGRGWRRWRWGGGMTQTERATTWWRAKA